MRYDLVTDMQQCVKDLEEALGALRQQIEAQPLLIARVFSLPPIEKGHEHDAITQIAVEQHLGTEARERALNHYCRLFMQHQSEKLSTKAAVRLPPVRSASNAASRTRSSLPRLSTASTS